MGDINTFATNRDERAEKLVLPGTNHSTDRSPGTCPSYCAVQQVTHELPVPQAGPFAAEESSGLTVHNGRIIETVGLWAAGNTWLWTGCEPSGQKTAPMEAFTGTSCHKRQGRRSLLAARDWGSMS